LLAVALSSERIRPYDATTEEDAYAEGRTDAQADLDAGMYKTAAFGTPCPDSAQYDQVMQEWYGVGVRPIAGCVITETDDAYHRGYSEIMGPALKSYVGATGFQEARVEAQARWQALRTGRQYQADTAPRKRK
jgi:hypothetical protein